MERKKLEIGGGGTVLVIDDEVKFLEIVSFMLTRLRFSELKTKDNVERLKKC